MASRPLHQKPFRKLGKRPAPAAPKLETESSEPKSVADFREEMHRLGAVPLAPAPTRVRLSKSAPRAELRVRETPTFYVEDQDGFVEGHRLPRNPRQIARLRGAPNSTLDLHGHDAGRARDALRTFLSGARNRGHERVLVIVGKGHRAPGGVGVLRGEIAGWLSRPPLAAHVLAFATAPQHLGGTGGVMVLLAPPAGASRARK